VSTSHRCPDFAMARSVGRFKAVYRLSRTDLPTAGLLHFNHATQLACPSTPSWFVPPSHFVWNEYSSGFPRNIVRNIHKLLILLTNLLWIFKYSNIPYKYAHTREHVFMCINVSNDLITHTSHKTCLTLRLSRNIWIFYLYIHTAPEIRVNHTDS
jgi:hypothetical protein